MARYQKYSPEEKLRILSGVVPGSREHGFRATSKRFKVAGGKSVVARWFAHKEDLADKRTSHRQQALSMAEKAQHIKQFIATANQAGKVVNYNDVQNEVQTKTGKLLSTKRLRAIGKNELGISFKKTKLTLYQDGKA